MKDYIYLLRPQQYVKNLFVFLPLFFALEISRVDLLLQLGIAFVILSLLASAVYIFNDCYDLEEDRRHPKKKDRPLAAGRITKSSALIFIILLLVISLPSSYLFNRAMFQLGILYLALNVAYTLYLKHIPVVDIIVIAIGFVIRIFIGGSVAQVWISPWIVIMTFLLALFLALAKRRDDVLIFLDNGGRSRKVIDGYNLPFIDALMVSFAAITIVAYMMYTLSPDITARFHTDKLYLTTLFVIAGIMRYLQIAMVAKNSGSPTEILWKDRFIQISILCWLLLFGFLIY